MQCSCNRNTQILPKVGTPYYEGDVTQRRIDMCKINVKKSILEIIEKNNLEILKIDLCNDYEFAARFYGGAVSSRVYTTLEDLDFEVDSIFMVRGVEIKILKNQYG